MNSRDVLHTIGSNLHQNYKKKMLECLFISIFLVIFVPGKTRFFTNRRYTYRYVATSVTGVTGTTNQTTGLRIEAKCEIEGLGQCEHMLKVGLSTSLSFSFGDYCLENQDCIFYFY